MKKFFKLSISIITSFSLLSASSSYGEIPESAKVTEILGANSIKVRRNQQGEYDNVDIGTVMRGMDKLDIPSSGRTFAKLAFYDSDNKPMGLTIQASIKNNLKTSYYFPCVMQSSDAVIIEWTNEKTKDRGCEPGGIKISKANKSPAKTSDVAPLGIITLNKQQLIAQSGPSRWLYCTVAGSQSGRTWYGVTSGSNPCEKPKEECIASGEAKCSELTMDFWYNKNPELTALVSCANSQEFTAKGDGSTIKEEIPKLWQQLESQKAKFCSLYVLKPDDILILPPPESQTKSDPKSNNNKPTVVQVNPDDACFDVNLYDGDAVVKSSKKPEGVSLQRGDRYNYCDEVKTDSTTKFDPTKESIDLQIFRANERGYKLCDQQQASGGQKGDTRTIQLTSTQGTMKFKYEMYGVPDRLEVIYQNQTILDTGFISGSGELSVPFNGDTGQVTIKLTGNQENAGTQWNYILYCPQEQY